MFISKSFSISSTILILNVFISSNDHCTVEVTFHVVRKIKKKEPRRGSKINTDRFPKQGGVRGMLSQEILLDLTPQSPHTWVSESFGQHIGQFHSPRMKPYKSAECYYCF